MADEIDTTTTPGPPSDFYILHWGLVGAVICTSLDDDTATRRLNSELPTGISSSWSIATDEADHRLPCDDNPTTHSHVLFTC